MHPTLEAIAKTLEALPTFETFNPSLEPLSFSQTPVVTFGYIMQVFFSLLIVLGLIYIASRYLLPKLQTQSRSSIIQIEDRVGVEPQVALYVVRAEGGRWLVAVSNKNITVIDKLKPPS
jgi:flagellar biogenesis protein FliO